VAHQRLDRVATHLFARIAQLQGIAQRAATVAAEVRIIGIVHTASGASHQAQAYSHRRTITTRVSV
jgi:hypothetical protein